ncbi:MAG: aldehyde dehydrogenase [Pelagibacteraceae bacterium]|jgi:aldehyde dehydrogenase (NAD+)/betaine-aldehyde dehydrogenase|nr:aldehyde dehydrogenase [Pelagibacteraceae bacterium]MBT6198026.1 aldehyde dehydrogenase [Pelagibacteraceae bacterium]MBT6355008.1 aldehyde dehydrogenase [Pelagibacteraceae bacterium]
MQKYKNYINGEFVESKSGNTFVTIDPSTEKDFAEICAAEEVEVNLAVKAASNAFKGEWSKILPYQRGQYLRSIGDQLKEKAELLGTIETKDTGKLYKETKFQANYIAEYYYYYAGLVDKIEGSTLPIDKEDMHVFTSRVPIGVVAAIIPWNSQMFLTAVKLAPALAMGNTIIIKASEVAPTPLLEFAKIIDKTGLPRGVVNIITGFADTCSKVLSSHPKINKIAFTGGVQTAKHIVRNSAENLSQLSLELGGKSPVVVFNDARKDNAINGIMASIFGASGQSCIAGSRLYLQENIYDDYLEELKNRTLAIKIGDPLSVTTQLGPLATIKQLTNIEAKIKETLEQGGRLITGGNKVSEFKSGYYFEPTIIECDNHKLPAAENELFGPVLSVMRFKDEQHAIKLMNDNSFGLAAGIFTENNGIAMRVSKAVQAGIVFVNTYRLISPVAPFGGFKNSGYGRESGLETMKDYSNTKTTWISTSTEPLSDPFNIR